MDEDYRSKSKCSTPSQVVPLVEVCPACGSPLAGQRCKVYCNNESCMLYRCIVENCAGD